MPELESRPQKTRLETTALRGPRITRAGLATAAVAFMTLGCADAQAQLDVRLEHDSEGERATREQLLRLVEEHDVSAWIYTTSIVIDETQIPHSHPVLTLHTRHLGDDDMLTSTFIHEQFHWLENGEDRERSEAFRAAMADFAALYPDAPGGPGTRGARDVESTYRHLVVCDMEFQGMTLLIGEARARELLARITHYEWIYERVLTDPRVREINTRHGMLVR